MSKVSVVAAELAPHLRLHLIATRAIAEGEVIVPCSAREIRDTRTWRTIQIDNDKHIYNEFLCFVDHSCEPNAVFDVDRLSLVAIHPIAEGHPVTFFYPGSEVELAKAFECRCGSASCIRYIKGGFYLTHQQMRWALDGGYCTAFMKEQFARLLGE